MSTGKTFFSTSFVLTLILFAVYCQDVEHGEPCSSTIKCRRDFDCINGRCACRYRRLQIYDRTLGVCLSEALGPCAETIDGITIDIPCVANAECRNETGFPECACRPGMRQRGRICSAAFGEPCSDSFQCHNPASAWDNAAICKNGKCDCDNLESFDEKTDRCVGLVGAMCGSIYICVEGAVCERFGGSEGTCQCTGAFKATPDRRCSLQQCPKVYKLV